MRLFIVLATTALVSGCTGESKIESICTDIAKDSLVDPSSMVINGLKVSRSEMKLSETYAAISKKYGGNTPEVVTRHTDQLVNSTKLPEYVFVDIDYTANGGSGKVREMASCTYIEGALPDIFLYAVTVGKNAFDASKLDELFARVKKPRALDSMYSVH
ncbi:hypothetical protein EJA70_19235 [Pseudomonas sp. PB103]|uniref:hypothetical protein n=1 Tax=Pseudomonas sp. PB103 TaxID=2494698 RepID=UPI00131DAFBB|nr:hypothetical protein [Pseudomonas sp. PB103]KAE9642374.1 hypothetical protein EJA70_19235 [Pseudomonas sp. PB103]